MSMQEYDQSNTKLCKNCYTKVDNDVCLRRQKEVGKLTQHKSKRMALHRGKQGLTSCARDVVPKGMESIK